MPRQLPILGRKMPTDTPRDFHLRDTPRDFHIRLKAVRVAYGEQTGRPELSGEKFATEIGLKPAAYRRYERGELQPTLGTLAALRRVTGISLDYLIADEDQGISSPKDMLLVCDADFPTRLGCARSLINLDAEQMAEAVGVHRRTYRRWESGRDPVPEPKWLVHIATLTGVTLPFLLHGLPDGLPPHVLMRLREAQPALWKLVSRDEEYPRETDNIVRLQERRHNQG